MQGKSHHVQVKEPYGNSNWLIRPSSCNPGCTMYTFCVFLGSLDVKKERKAIAHKNMLFLIFLNMIWIVLKYCFC